jgi:hypothetical protein
VSDNSAAYFTDGIPIVNAGGNSPLPSGIYVGTQPGLSGVAVQQNGNLLAASVTPDNQVYLMDKISGDLLTSFSVNSPGRLSFSPDGSLWVISSNNVICYTNLSSSPSAVVIIPNFSEPLAVAVNPTNANLILVADGGGSQQVEGFNEAGALLWTYGQAGGYQSNGVAVATNKFWFFNGENDGTFLSFAPDGSFWVGDGGNYRSMHFSAARSYIEQIMYQPHSYIASADQNQPSRVCNQFLEFNVDYTKPLAQGWTLVNNWKVGVPPVNISWNEGIYEVTTFTNGRTYALIDNNYYYPYVNSELCELATNQLRLTGILPEWSDQKTWISFGPDGSARRSPIGEAAWYETTLSGFDASNNPAWNPEILIASASAGSTDPVPRTYGFGNIRVTISTNNILISMDQSLNNGWHLGGVRVGATNWLWKASPAVASMNGCGTYEIANGVQYGGNTLQAVDRNVMYGYHGEFFRGQGQAGQTMHFYDDGLFVGQFGEASPGHSAYEGALPGFAGNGQAPSMVKTATGDYYLWVNDESDHGPQRWHFVNARNIREQTGSGMSGGTITLTNQACGFPTDVTGTSGNQSGKLSWLPVTGADSYNVRYSLLNGGPYNLVAGNTTNPGYVAGGLTNGQTYYFAVTAIQAGVEGMPSEQVPITPFDGSQNVLCAGSMSEGGQFTPVVDINSGAPTLGQPSYIGAEHLTGVLNLRELDYYGYGNLQNESAGTEGYVIYDWGGPGSNLTNIPSRFAITQGGGWSDISNTMRQFKVDNFLGVNEGLVASPIGSINIEVSDTNFHYLTVVSPAQFNYPRNFTMRLTSTNGASAAYCVNESIGLSHVFQFLFQGNVILSADASVSGGSGAIVEALFLDDVSPPTNSSTTTLIITNGLVANYPLASNGIDAWAGNNLTLLGSPTFSDGAINWNGDVPTLGYSLPRQWPQSGLTVSGWINMSDTTSNYIVASCYGDATGSLKAAYMQFFTLSNGLIARVVQDIDANFIGRSTPAVLTSGWHFAAFTWSGGTASSSIKVYLDGTQVDNRDANDGVFRGAYSGSDLPLSVGAQFSDGWGIAGKFYGSEKEVAMYNRALSGAEIGTLYTNGISTITATLPALTGAAILGNGVFRFSFSNNQNISITVLSTTNLSLPLSNWTVLGSPSNIAPGLFQFTTQPMTNDLQRFYTICSP